MTKTATSPYDVAADPEVGAKSGGLFSSWGLAKEYGFTDEAARLRAYLERHS